MTAWDHEEWDPSGSDGNGSDASWEPDGDEPGDLVDTSSDEGDEDVDGFVGWFDSDMDGKRATRKDRNDYYKPISKAEAELRLGELLSTKVLEGPWDCTEICEVAYYAKYIGASEGSVVSKLARAPNDPSRSHYSRHCKKVMGFKGDNHEIINVPAFNKRDPTVRSTFNLAVRSPHEAIHEEVVEHPGLLEKVEGDGGTTSIA